MIIDTLYPARLPFFQLYTKSSLCFQAILKIYLLSVINPIFSTLVVDLLVLEVSLFLLRID